MSRSKKEYIDNKKISCKKYVNKITQQIVYPLFFRRDVLNYTQKTNDYIVYKITNIETNDSYIGFTSFTLELRWRGHCNNANNTKKSNKFINAIRYYGIKNFKCEILEQYSTSFFAKAGEIYWIDFYDTYKNGYNSTKGGDGSAGVISETRGQNVSKALKGKKRNLIFVKEQSIRMKKKGLTPEHKLKLINASRLAHKNLVYTEETREKMRKAKIGYVPWCKGKKIHTQEQKDKWSKQRKGKPTWCKGKKMSQEFCDKNGDSHSRAVNMYDLNLKLQCTHKSLKVASLYLMSLNLSNVYKHYAQQCCHRTRVSTGGFIWRYADDDEFMCEQEENV